MNTKYPLTNEGVQQLLNELYELPQPELQAEADALSTDFRGWVIRHFDLTERQINYLNEMNQKTVDFTAAECSFAMENRLPILLDKAEKLETNEDPPFKWGETKSNLTAGSGSDGRATVGGDVTIKISYTS